MCAADGVDEDERDTWLIANILRLRRTLRRRERWTSRRLLEQQQRELATLRAFAAARSPFYRQLFRGLESAPVSELPVLTKATMMEHFDQITTDPTLHLADLRAYLERLDGNEPVRRSRRTAGPTNGPASLGFVDNIPAGAAGKRPLVVADKAAIREA